MFQKALENVKSHKPLVHTITNLVSINDCANILLACGASPIMAENELEVEEIAANSDGLVLNTGTPSVQKFTAMLKAGLAANHAGIPVVLDPVGVGASSFRRENICRLLKKIHFSAIRCNQSELFTLSEGVSAEKGVDTTLTGLSLEHTALLARKFAGQHQTVVAVTGKVDIITDGKRIAVIKNGSPVLARITGAGCMLSALTGAFCASNPDLFTAVAAAVGLVGLCGERAEQNMYLKHTGSGSFRVCLIDEVSLISPVELQGGIRVEYL